MGTSSIPDMEEKSPADGIAGGLAKINGRTVVVESYDKTVFAGTEGSVGTKKTKMLHSFAEKRGHPIINLVEGGGRLAPGLYFLDTSSPQLADRNYYGRKHLMVVSETNLTLKSGQRDALVWATDLASGQPAPGLNVDFYDDERQQLGTAMTDDEGVARLDLGKRRHRSSILAVALADGSQGFSAVSENWMRGISPYEFGLDLAYGLPEYNVHLYTDRPIYRPGQTIYFKGLVRAEDDVTFRLPDLGQVHVTVRDAAYEIILDEMAARSDDVRRIYAYDWLEGEGN